jgi:hypothetical protein
MMMTDKEKESFEKQISELGIDPEQMQMFVHKMAILTAIRNTANSVDFDVLAQEMFKLKEGVVPVEVMREIIEFHYESLKEEGLLTEKGTLTPLAFIFVSNYEEMLFADKETLPVKGIKGERVVATSGGGSAEVGRVNRGDKGTVVLTDSITSPDGEFVFVKFDTISKPVVWPVNFIEGTGDEKVEVSIKDEEEYQEEFDRAKRNATSLNKAYEELQELLTSEDKLLLEKTYAAAAELYTLTKEEREQSALLQNKISQIMAKYSGN